MKIAAITNGISGNYEEACRIMNETGLKYAEIQHLDGKQIEEFAIGEKRSVPGVPIETLAPEEAYRIKETSDKYGVEVCCITTHAFVGMPIKSTEVGDKIYSKHMRLLENGIHFAKVTGAKLVRAMCCERQPVSFGYHGAGEWLANDNRTWGKFISFYRPVVELAEKENIDIVIENGNGNICSSYLMRKMADDLGSSRLKYLWDISNAMYYSEMPTLGVYEMIKDILAHVHIKDMILDISKSYMDIVKIGTGQLGPYLPDIAEALRRDSFGGCISMENIYKPDSGDFVDGYKIDLVEMKRLFG